jgi:RNA polymerase sigma-70 factor (ECF subfamily)
MRQGVARLRARLDAIEQTLLVLRVDQRLSWEEIADVLAGPGPGESLTPAALRKRYERLKDKLRRLARAEGLLGSEGGTDSG